MSTADLAAAAGTDLATGLTARDRRHAALVACGYVADAAEAREVLEALGLLEDLQAVHRLTA